MSKEIITISFEAPSLGIVLRRNTSGMCFVGKILEQSHNLQVGDILLKVNDRALNCDETGGGVTKPEWDIVIEEIRKSPRPIKIEFLRQTSLHVEIPDGQSDISGSDGVRQSQSQSESGSGPSSARGSLTEGVVEVVDSLNEVEIEAGSRHIDYRIHHSGAERVSEEQEQEVCSTIPFESSNRDSREQEREQEQGSHVIDDAVDAFLRDYNIQLIIPHDTVYPTSTPQRGRQLIKKGVFKIVTSRLGFGYLHVHRARLVLLFSDILLIFTIVNKKKAQLEQLLSLSTCKVQIQPEFYRDLAALKSLLPPELDPIPEGDRDSDNDPNDDVGTTSVPPFILEEEESSSSKETSEILIHCSTKGSEGKVRFVTSTPNALLLTEAIVNCMHGLVGEELRVPGWVHACVQGGLCDLVITGNEIEVLAILKACEDGTIDPCVLDDADEDGYSPLHYACMMRRNSLIHALHEAGADVTVTDPYGMTPLHWLAIHLESSDLRLLSSNIFDTDMEDSFGRTPLFLACVEGNTESDVHDTYAVRDIILTLGELGANICLRDTFGRAAIHYAASRWCYDTVNSILALSDQNIHNRISEKADEAGDLSSSPEAVGSMRSSIDGMTALHYALSGFAIPHSGHLENTSLGKSLLQLPINGKVVDIQAIGGTYDVTVSDNRQSDDSFTLRERESSVSSIAGDEGDCARIVKLLLMRGAPPNAKDVFGRSPLHILADNAISFGSSLGPLVALLVANGARVSSSFSPTSPSPHQRSSTPPPPPDTVHHSRRTALSPVPPSTLLSSKDILNKLAIALPDHEQYIQEARQELNSYGVLDVSHLMESGDLSKVMKIAPEMTYQHCASNQCMTVALKGTIGTHPDGCCVLCNSKYGLMRHRYQCGLCAIECCDDCSLQKFHVEDKGKQRACDSCFNILKAMIKENPPPSSLPMYVQIAMPDPHLHSSSGSSGTRYSTPSPTLGSSDDLEGKRRSLFGGSKKSIEGERDSASMAHQSQSQAHEYGGANDAMRGISEAHEALQERGEKLSQLADKSGDLANAAGDFAKLAAQLKKQNRRTSWWG